MVWGSGTNVGKTVISAGLLRAFYRGGLDVGYLKPVQTGLDLDEEKVRSWVGPGLDVGLTLVRFREAVSPDLAARRESWTGSDKVLVASLVEELRRREGRAMLVETAGGVLSPSPCGVLQGDLYRPMRLPAILVGDGRVLGGISATLTALEALEIRGYTVPLVIVVERSNAGGMENFRSIAENVRGSTSVQRISFDNPQEVTPWLMETSTQTAFDDAVSLLCAKHREWKQANVQASLDSRKMFWWPFTQHGLVNEVTVIDSAHQDDFTVLRNGEGNLERQFDGCGSWWTNGGIRGSALSAKVGAATLGRYGHVMFPECVHLPAMELTRRLLLGVGRGWASRVFFSDDGSTGVEVAIKMAFRLRLHRLGLPLVSENLKDVKLITLEGAYHGDTLGAMVCSEPGEYNETQTPWYTCKSFVVACPTVAIVGGCWTEEGLEGKFQFPQSTSGARILNVSMRQADGQEGDRLKRYYAHTKRVLAELSTRDDSPIIGGLMIEPVLQGAAGMRMIDPLFQRILIDVCQEKGIPVIFDEVFSGCWRLGYQCARDVLGVCPTIGIYAKLLTSATIPLAVTLASEEVFEAFLTDSKREALLHGHSYTAHPVGCALANEALQCLEEACKGTGRRYWSEERARNLSRINNVRDVTCVGTILAVRLHNSGNLQVVPLVKQLRDHGIFVRPLGNVVYLMCSPLTDEEICERLTNILEDALRRGTDNGA
eukprot:CAMPEP_0184684622 /NCGR_PEP_ID=MMETSP0312-20130426/16007_1 /TAXON_ID=31354 /ORGANISM="Compsopogon coeruleus, Strain SAG 36.94" /LENGTH=713 /DNA_ID=CAMNT_0027137971 /DNA_START=1 /DNA_END=2142 /DNA_ORIENTATION=-